ncbi:MAG: hypothetical protein KGI54_10570 [Pseudomonadota bacterium]|nr:hypothetical protein [Pseudomonadota bacterium]
MIFTPEFHEDIRRYYKGTFVKFKETGDTLFWIQDCSAKCVYGCTSDDTQFELYLSEDFPYEVDYVLPRKAYFQFEKRAHLLQRKPAKQYQRGVSPENTRILNLDTSGLFKPAGVNFKVLGAFVEKQAYPSFNTALANKDKNVSTALTSRMAYANKVNTIYIDEFPVAQVVRKDKAVICNVPIFLSEVQAVIEGSSFKVVV